MSCERGSNGQNLIATAGDGCLFIWIIFDAHRTLLEACAWILPDFLHLRSSVRHMLHLQNLGPPDPEIRKRPTPALKK